MKGEKIVAWGREKTRTKTRAAIGSACKGERRGEKRAMAGRKGGSSGGEGQRLHQVSQVGMKVGGARGGCGAGGARRATTEVVEAGELRAKREAAIGVRGAGRVGDLAFRGRARRDHDRP